MNILELLRNHRHYWGVPHARPSDNRLVFTCYECGKDREVKVDLRPYLAKKNSKAENRQKKAA